MDETTKRRLAESTRRAFTTAIADLGFRRTKTTFWARPEELVIPFIHLHLFRSDPTFRVHFGVRVLNDDFPGVSLNGPSSFDGFAIGVRKYVFAFGESDESRARCAGELAAFVADAGVRWFAEFKDASALLTRETSPLLAPERERLTLAIEHRQDPKCIELSQKLLGLA